MKLKQLLDGISYKVQQGNAELEISDIQYDSRKVEICCIFLEKMRKNLGFTACLCYNVLWFIVG